MKNRSNLDEQQEQTLLRLESKACWLAYWALLISMLGQVIIYGFQDCIKYVAGEWIVFMCLCLYLSIMCLRKGIWDRKLKANTATNLAVSVFAAALLGVVSTIAKIREYPDKIGGCILVGVIFAVITLFVTFIALELVRIMYHKKITEINEELEEEEE